MNHPDSTRHEDPDGGLPILEHAAETDDDSGRHGDESNGAVNALRFFAATDNYRSSG